MKANVKSSQVLAEVNLKCENPNCTCSDCQCGADCNCGNEAYDK